MSLDGFNKFIESEGQYAFSLLWKLIIYCVSMIVMLSYISSLWLSVALIIGVFIILFMWCYIDILMLYRYFKKSFFGE